MSTSYAKAVPPAPSFFASAREHAEQVEQSLGGLEMMRAPQHQIEEFVLAQSREWGCRMLEAQHALLAARELTVRVEDAEAIEHTSVRDSERHVLSLVGRVPVPRLAYQAPGCEDLHPLDASLNLPRELYSHGVQKMIAKESARASFDEVVELMRDHTAAPVPKRQVEQLVVRAARDFDRFYALRASPPEATRDLLVVGTDGKGVSMRREDLREGTRRKAETRRPKLETRLSPGEKADRKRMAQVATVYTLPRWERTAADLLHGVRDEETEASRPKPRDKRVWASVQKEQRGVIRAAFDEAQRRDPEHLRTWVVLLDGARPQLRAVKAEARRLGVKVTIVVDLVHVLEYLWKAGHALFGTETETTERWVGDRFLGLLTGRSGGETSRTIRWWAERQGDALDEPGRRVIKKVCTYLSDRSRTRLMRYQEALREGLPIGTGVIEGVCRYLVKDRMDRTGACWSLEGAEAVLRLRALRASGDFEEYWTFHLACDKERNYAAHYAPGKIPDPLPAHKPRLRRVR